MNRRVAAVVTDLDGTLWDARRVVHRRTRQALARLGDAGVPVLAATARRVRGARRGLEAAGLRLPVAALDGAIGREIDDRTFHRVTFDRAAGERVLAAFAAHGLSPCAYLEARGRHDPEVLLEASTSTHPAHRAEMGEDAAVVPRLDQAVAGAGVLLFGVVGIDAARAGAAAEDLADLGAVQCHTDRVVGGTSLRVAPAGTSKASAASAWCRARGIDLGAVVAVGDAVNDADLLAAAGTAVRVRDGDASLAPLADHVIDPPGVGGWAGVADLALGDP